MLLLDVTSIISPLLHHCSHCPIANQTPSPLLIPPHNPYHLLSCPPAWQTYFPPFHQHLSCNCGCCCCYHSITTTNTVIATLCHHQSSPLLLILPLPLPRIPTTSMSTTTIYTLAKHPIYQYNLSSFKTQQLPTMFPFLVWKIADHPKIQVSNFS